MAVMLLMEWNGMTKEQYDAVRKDVNWEGDRPKGAVFHVASFGADGAHIVDIWDSEADFQAFLESRLGAATQRAGIQGQPDVHFYPVHATYNPGIAKS